MMMYERNKTLCFIPFGFWLVHEDEYLVCALWWNMYIWVYLFFYEF